ncbi:hypothetical protein B5M09_003724 [Aphanomyces astaci]|uniref:J domain-containing protein n=1 Tax=Aphanomyces astaci TaxID=112090 RepID=A0A425CW60_APHAT|nr:hypothetical protein B5M09_003724 [Aphanomyces astaci]
MSTPDSTVSDDLYVLLEVERTASEAEIKASYRKLALKFHPDRNRGVPGAAEHFKKLATAYAVLSDPNQRRFYDLSCKDGSGGSVAGLHGMQPIDVNEMNGFGRMLGCVLVISAHFQLSLAYVCMYAVVRYLQTGMGGTNVKDLPVGMEMSGKVDKQEGHFFRVAITDRIVESGFVMTCRSIAKNKFKLILFDKDGSVRSVQESDTRAKHTSADMFLTRLELMDTDDTFKCLSEQEQTLPEVFHRLKTLERIQTPALDAGTHLFCVYGDNWFSALHYVIQCLPIEPDTVESIQHVEQDLLRTKLELDAYQAEFTAAQKAFEAAVAKADGLDKRTKGLMATRRAAYDDFLSVAALPYKDMNRKPGAQDEAAGTFASIWNRFSVQAAPPPGACKRDDAWSNTVIRYGQTGSGKTHTMTGFLTDMGRDLMALSSSIEMTAVELVGSKCVDLLHDRKKVLICESEEDQTIHLVHSASKVATSVPELLALFHEAVSRRATESTQANTVSSRSHLIVFLKLVGAGPPSDGGQMVLLDLAGRYSTTTTNHCTSERKEDQYTNDKQRQQETIETNMSHLALKQCLLAKEQNGHVPYRNSALTRILKNSLWATHKACQAAIVVTASPIPADTEHTLCSLVNARRMVEVNPTVAQSVLEIVETSDARQVKLFKTFSHVEIQAWLGRVSKGALQAYVDNIKPAITGAAMLRLPPARLAQLCNGHTGHAKLLQHAIKEVIAKEQEDKARERDMRRANHAKNGEDLRSKFIEFDCDDETQQFLDSCFDTGVYHMITSMLSTVLNVFYSVTDTNGMLNRTLPGGILSHGANQDTRVCRGANVRLLPRPSRASVELPRWTLRRCVMNPQHLSSPSIGKLLDIGAGDGNVTAKLATFVDTVYATEVSMPMVRALNAKGFK